MQKTENVAVEASTREIQSAVDHILFIRQQMHAMGANDSEMPRLDEIVAKLKRKEITPEAARAAAEMIQSSKQIYH